MMRAWACLLLLSVAQPAWAGEEGPYYGPMKRWHGIGYKFGYADRVEKDGSWRIDAAVHGGGDAIDMALYRAAERARDEGYRYVFFLGGTGSTSPGIDAATIYARPSRDAVPPTGCRSKKLASCYTADVGEVLRILGGPGGRQPGVPIVDHRDEFGREVFLSGYGTGGVATLVPGGVARSHMTTIVDGKVAIREGATKPPAPVTAVALPPARSMATIVPAAPVMAVQTPAAVMRRQTVDPTADDRFKATLKAVQPVRGREPTLGWTISD
jgi:hypothetical protein